MSDLKYTGLDRRSVARTGRVNETPEVLVRRLFDKGWRELRVFEDDELVGQIGPSSTPERRLWWAVS